MIQRLNLPQTKKTCTLLQKIFWIILQYLDIKTVFLGSIKKLEDLMTTHPLFHTAKSFGGELSWFIQTAVTQYYRLGGL